MSLSRLTARAGGVYFSPVLRSLAERFTRPFIFRRRLSSEYGGCAFYASTEGGLKFLKPNITNTDPDLLGFARAHVKPGSVVWDIGANVGLFTFAAAGLAGRHGFVLSVEPDLWLCRLIQRSLRIKQARAPIELLPAAISDRIGVSRLAIANRSRAANQLENAPSEYTQSGGIREIQSTVTLTLDWLLDHYPAPNVVKIDIEGMELIALEASPRLLTTIKPIIYTETFDERIGNLLERSGYIVKQVGVNLIAYHQGSVATT